MTPVLFVFLAFTVTFTVTSPLYGPVALGTSCASLCAELSQTGGSVCEDSAFAEDKKQVVPELQACFACLHESGYIVGKDEEEASRIWHLFLRTVWAGCKRNPRLSGASLSLDRSYSPQVLHRRQTKDAKNLSKAAIAGIAAGSTIAFLLVMAALLIRYRRRHARQSEMSPPGRWKGPRPLRTASSLDFRCRTRVTPMASRVDFRRLHGHDRDWEVGEGGGEIGGEEKRAPWGVQPGDALGSNPVLASTLPGYIPAGSGSSPPTQSNAPGWDGPTEGPHSRSTNPPYVTNANTISPNATTAAPSPRVPAPAYSPQRGVSPYTPTPATPPSATPSAASPSIEAPSSTKSSAPLLPARQTFLPMQYGSVSPSSHHSAESGDRPRYSPGYQGWETPAPTKTLRTQRGRWDLHARLILQEGVDSSATTPEMGMGVRGPTWAGTRPAEIRV
ncbi:uncharacterized protein DNG_01160 [Cephalotrichum gorgonifer]|uniref:Uncharacterized protein n=1 Tax=Cephalotrichum gorgonifer TaxID=2041049 RepID=A0AAE8SRK8_9PEZI|nr:uncharacterized protein DNG_01160 [Cephalotrichum gorgonifer]